MIAKGKWIYVPSPQRGLSSRWESVLVSSGRGGFFLEKLMMRLIFLPAARLIDPVSSENVPFLPFPSGRSTGSIIRGCIKCKDKTRNKCLDSINEDAFDFLCLQRWGKNSILKSIAVYCGNEISSVFMHSLNQDPSVTLEKWTWRH